MQLIDIFILTKMFFYLVIYKDFFILIIFLNFNETLRIFRPFLLLSGKDVTNKMFIFICKFK